MRRTRFCDEQIIGILQENAAGAKIGRLCRRRGISGAIFYAWRNK